MPMMRPKKGIEFGIPDPPKPGPNEPEYEYRYLQYPKALYRNEPDEATGLPYTTTIVESEEAAAALGDEWHDKPAAWDHTPKAQPQKKAKVVA